ncbi:hypothetical protein FBUS_06143 [Fasciolopsis buskii]|uniref:RING-type domain-containing protein n=1 Tax=Fasciolopsis buskii TaxID=27845 RepID=A0A8E0S328_9TREM|nr:hypothetical protein FBUS_06143 [Fasciolopsis buski]
MRRVSSLEPLEDMVTCPIDLNLLVDPRLLPCGHAFCCDCLTRYMIQVASIPPNGLDQTTGIGLFSCPICRAACAIPKTLKADSFPKAFNHTAILEFLRKTRLSDLRVKATTPTNLTKPFVEDGVTDQPCRKTSIQVSSQMLNYIVNDIASYEKVGKIGEIDKRVILNDVNKLMEQLRIAPVVPQCPPVSSALPKGNDASPNISPSDSTRNLGRFQTFGNRIRSLRRSSGGSETNTALPTYAIYRDVETARQNMKRNAVYHVLAKGKDCCIMRPGEEHQPVDMQMISTEKTSTVLRCTLTTNVERDDLILWRQQISIERDNFLFEPRKHSKTPEKLLQTEGPVKSGIPGKIQVQYVRFHGKLIYMTCVVKRSSGSGDTPSNSTNTGLSDCGVIICCSAVGLGVKDCPNDPLEQRKVSERDNFPVISTSHPFERDSVGQQHPDRPILFGIDIDHQTDNIYVAQPANGMLCRLPAGNLKKISGTWYLNEPQLSPYFLCFARSSIWATCPKDDKIVILDLETDGFHHFSPSVSFGITPSHIVHTTDERIVLLDQTQSRLYWITKVHTTICVQNLNVQFTHRLSRKFLAIQPVDDSFTDVVSSASGIRTHLLGGILCAHDYGCSLIYPKREMARSKASRLSCLRLCSF